jgi:hypothetical protein
VTLGIQIDEKHSLALFGESCPKVHGGGGLANTPLLHRYGDRSGQELLRV